MTVSRLGANGSERLREGPDPLAIDRGVGEQCLHLPVSQQTHFGHQRSGLLVRGARSTPTESMPAEQLNASLDRKPLPPRKLEVRFQRKPEVGRLDPVDWGQT